jgi:hypothetical protein
MGNQSRREQHSKSRFTITRRQAAEVVLILLTTLGLSWFVVFGTNAVGWDFRNNLWSPSYLLLHRQSPYKPDVLFDSSSALWMPTIIGAFFPLGFLPLQQASNLWFVGNALGVVVLAWISSGFRRPPILVFAIALVVAFLFPPLVSHLRLGQLSIGITLLFLIVTIWNDRMPLLLSASLLAIALSKPQLAILVLPGFLFSYYRSKGVRAIVLLVVLLLASILVMTIPLFIADPSWYTDFVTALQQNPSWEHPSSLAALTSLTQRFGPILWIVIALTVFISSIWLWVKLPSQVAVLWSLALTPLVTPYVWTWDFVMILPLFISSLFQVKTPRAFWLLLVGYVFCWALIVKVAFSGDVSNYCYWWVPWTLVGMVACATVVDASADNSSSGARCGGSFASIVGRGRTTVLKFNAEEPARIAQEIGAEVRGTPVRSPPVLITRASYTAAPVSLFSSLRSSATGPLQRLS